MSFARAAKLPLQNSSISDETLKLPASAPSIALIGTAPFIQLCKLQGMQTFRVHLSDISVSANSASVSEEAPDLSNIPKEYHDFADIFSKAKAEKLAPHKPYNLKINLEEGTSPPIVLMYPLSQSKLEVLHNFLNDHLQTGFICQTSSSHGALVIFTLKKDKTIRLCIDFRGLNKITKKTNIPFRLFPTSLPLRVKPISIPPLISNMPISLSVLQTVMNGKPLSEPATILFNGSLCPSDLPMLPQLSSVS